ncbi:hypothetical protein EVAR_100043_1 [Eumeta japonica]|uniref:Uncharacterized protein n=1 Tax=Eumeta variegata TaxID=151549 RepID=A0A4C1STT6_EUMVA|nr:hypothetical protein EVAR_100043_1 [Eumeta japonica]
MGLKYIVERSRVSFDEVQEFNNSNKSQEKINVFIDRLFNISPYEFRVESNEADGFSNGHEMAYVIKTMPKNNIPRMGRRNFDLGKPLRHSKIERHINRQLRSTKEELNQDVGPGSKSGKAPEPELEVGTRLGMTAKSLRIKDEGTYCMSTWAKS